MVRNFQYVEKMTEQMEVNYSKLSYTFYILGTPLPWITAVLTGISRILTNFGIA